MTGYELLEMLNTLEPEELSLDVWIRVGGVSALLDGCKIVEKETASNNDRGIILTDPLVISSVKHHAEKGKKMKLDKLANNALRVVKQHTESLQKEFGEGFRVAVQPSTVFAKMGNMFGVTQGGVNKGLTHLVDNGQLKREYRGKKAVYFLP